MSNEFEQAKDPLTSQETLTRQCSNCTAAELRKIPKGTFKACDEHTYIRSCVASNPSMDCACTILTPLEVLIKLASDEEWQTRYNVANNSSTPEKNVDQTKKDSKGNFQSV
jgi:hypothetical protein